MNEPLHLISLGAGVQSSTMALMAAYGEITPMPDGAIFADTQNEPASVYHWLDWLKRQLPFPVYRVTAGNLAEMALEIHKRKDGTGEWCKSGIPAYTVNWDGTRGQQRRQCTSDFKITPIQGLVRRLLRDRGASKSIQWIGISLDEVHRMKPSQVQYMEHIWPLIERRITRADCLAWMANKGFASPPRSACVFCPYHSNEEWRKLKEDEPEEFTKAVKFEHGYQAAKARTLDKRPYVPYLHADRVPLENVDFRPKVERDEHWGNECEGMCGV
jgi:hypothetical protein